MPGYAGDLSVKEAWEVLAAAPQAVLIDVRTRPEWQFVGVPDLDPLGKRPVFIEWQTFPTMQPNADFLDAVREAAPDADAPILFLCRSGGRSRAAALAATAAGYRRCYNIAGGFEGGLDGARHRGTAAGWKAEGLPWIQE